MCMSSGDLPEPPCRAGSGTSAPEQITMLSSACNVCSDVPFPFGGPDSILSPSRIMPLVTPQHVGVLRFLPGYPPAPRPPPGGAARQHTRPQRTGRRSSHQPEPCPVPSKAPRPWRRTGGRRPLRSASSLTIESALFKISDLITKIYQQGRVQNKLHGLRSTLTNA